MAPCLLNGYSYAYIQFGKVGVAFTTKEGNWRATVFDWKVGELLNHVTVSLHFISSYFEITVQANKEYNKKCSCHCCTYPKSHTEAIMRILQIVTYVVRDCERNGAQRSWEQRYALAEPWWAAMGTSQNEVALNNEEIKPVAIAIIELC